MIVLTKSRCLGLLLPVLALASAVSLWACSVPVFRYALEHWAPDPYQAILFHRGPLSEAQQALARDLTADGLAGELHANITLRTIDLDADPAPDALDLWRQLNTDTLPWLMVRYPAATRLPGHIWSGPLAESALRPLLDSPARREITRRIADGQSGVWVLLESGDRAADTAAAERLQSRLAYLMTVLELPRLDAEDIAKGLVSVGAGDLRLEFSVLRLARHDPAEQTFVRMLLGTEPDLADSTGPIAFPVFGRGRALYALLGAGINHETIDEACSFLIGRCSCQVKELNPGVDLLLAADWAGMVKRPADPGDLPPLASLVEAAPVTVTISGGDEESAARSARAGSRSVAMTVAGGFALAALFAAGLFLWRRTPR